MRVGLPVQGTGEPEGSPQCRPIGLRCYERKNSRVASGSSALYPRVQSRLPICGSGSILSPDTNYCQTFIARYLALLSNLVWRPRLALRFQQ